jgi:hypothetical protein
MPYVPALPRTDHALFDTGDALYEVHRVTPGEAEAVGCPGATVRLVGQHGTIYGTLAVGRLYRLRAVAQFTSWPTGGPTADYVLPGSVWRAQMEGL